MSERNPKRAAAACVECPRCAHVFRAAGHEVPPAPLKKSRKEGAPPILTTACAEDLYALLLRVEGAATDPLPSSSPSSKKQGERETSTHFSSSSEAASGVGGEGALFSSAGAGAVRAAEDR